VQIADATSKIDLVKQGTDWVLASHFGYPADTGKVTSALAPLAKMTAAGELTAGSTRLWLEQVVATGRHVAGLVGWSSTFRGQTMEGRELAVFHVEGGRIVEAWFYPEDPEVVLAFFGG
jgi:hypothetical protein